MGRHLLQDPTDALRPARLVRRIELRDASLVVLAATGDLRTVLSKEQRKRREVRIAHLAVCVGLVAHVDEVPSPVVLRRVSRVSR